MKYSILTTTGCLLAAAADGFTLQSSSSSSTTTTKTAFVGQPFHPRHHAVAQSSSSSSHLQMDLEEPLSASRDLLKRFNVPMPASLQQSNSNNDLHSSKKQPQQQYLQIPKPSSTAPDAATNNKAVDELLEKHGLPWMSSIDPTYPVGEDPERGLFYMPFFQWQIQFMKDNLTDLRILPTESKSGKDLTYIEGSSNNNGKAKNNNNVRMITLCFTSQEYRKIRMTVYDAGNRTQVFTSLFYPSEEYNLPVLGVDLLQFNQDRHLCVVDYQPIAGPEQNHAKPYEHLLQPIRDQYPSLQGKMTKRFYDENHFFSNQMLYSRFENEQQEQDNNNNNKMENTEQQQQQQHPVYRDLFPAYQQYVETHLQLIQSTQPNPLQANKVLQGQADYDTYSADRDPAHAMFGKVFGNEFADEFVYDVLFSLSQGESR